MKNLAFFFAVWGTPFLLLLFVVAECLPKFQYEQSLRCCGRLSRLGRTVVSFLIWVNQLNHLKQNTQEILETLQNWRRSLPGCRRAPAPHQVLPGVDNGLMSDSIDDVIPINFIHKTETSNHYNSQRRGVCVYISRSNSASSDLKLFCPSKMSERTNDSNSSSSSGKSLKPKWGIIHLICQSPCDYISFILTESLSTLNLTHKVKHRFYLDFLMLKIYHQLHRFANLF